MDFLASEHNKTPIIFDMCHVVSVQDPFAKGGYTSIQVVSDIECKKWLEHVVINLLSQNRMYICQMPSLAYIPALHKPKGDQWSCLWWKEADLKMV